MRAILVALLVVGCTGTTGPSDNAVLRRGVWHITLADGTTCRVAYGRPATDEPREAIAVCRLVHDCGEVHP